MSQFFITCKESRIESNRSFYSSFFLGPFDPSESLTVANALRRTLLSELPGIAIISVEIEGVSHEYSNLLGVRDSVLDVLLNLKEIVLKKLSKNMRPQIGYLRVRGPGIVRAGDLRLPPLIQCVDPEQYIATLAEDGFLNMRFIIDEGKNYLRAPFKKALKINPKTFMPREKKITSEKKKRAETSPSFSAGFFFPNFFKRAAEQRAEFKKRRLILKKLNQLCLRHNSSILKNYYQHGLYFNKKNTLKLNHFVRSKAFFKQNLKASKVNSFKNNALNCQQLNLLNVDAVFNPINKVNYIIEVNEHKIVEKAFEKRPFKKVAGSDTYEMVNAAVHQSFKTTPVPLKAHQRGEHNFSKKITLEKLNPLLNKPVFRCLENLLNYQLNLVRLKNIQAKKQVNSKEFFSLVSNDSFSDANLTKNFKISNNLLSNNVNVDNIEQMIGLKNSLMSAFLNGSRVGDSTMESKGIDLSILESKKDHLKHNIILEIWTNGSLHPREAMYEAFKHLVKLFSKLKKIKIFAACLPQADLVELKKKKSSSEEPCNQIFKSDQKARSEKLAPLIFQARGGVNFIQKVNNENFELCALNENIFLGKYAGLKTPLLTNASFSLKIQKK